MRILVVEDNPRVARIIACGLQDAGYAVDVAPLGAEGQQMASHTAYDAIVLDLMLPDCDGLDVCRALRGQGVRTPILLLTTMGTTSEKVAGLDAGADDYLTKPFQFDEVLARVRSLMRRGQAAEGSILRAGGIEFDLCERRITVAGKPVRLGLRESSVLEYLMRHAGNVVSLSDLQEHVWNEAFDGTSNVVTVHISTLRRRLGAEGCGASIETVSGAGYRLCTIDTELSPPPERDLASAEPRVDPPSAAPDQR